jgi:hypothetical protein
LGEGPMGSQWLTPMDLLYSHTTYCKGVGGWAKKGVVALSHYSKIFVVG